MVKIEFKNSLPDGCFEWLWKNVGNGNYDPNLKQFTDFEHFDWFYERKWEKDKTITLLTVHGYVVTVWIKDDELALLTKLRWS
jgi:hypothetical protein